jgi:hypothetical protein
LWCGDASATTVACSGVRPRQSTLTPTPRPAKRVATTGRRSRRGQRVTSRVAGRTTKVRQLREAAKQEQEEKGVTRKHQKRRTLTEMRTVVRLGWILWLCFRRRKAR